MKPLILLFLSVPLLAQHIGDKAPSIPSTYVSSHPRLGSPIGVAGALSYTWVDALYATGSGGIYGTVYKAAANAWDNASPGQLYSCRRLLIAYMADKHNSGPDNATWLTKIKGLADLSGQGSCQSLAYDWIYDDLDATSRTDFLTALDTASNTAESTWGTNSGANTSPYNDNAYLNGIPHFMWFALAQYPDAGATGLAHLRYAMDCYLNIMLPVWRQQFSRDGKATSASSSDDGGAWAEGWGDYVNKASGLNVWIAPDLLAWANASGRGTAFFTADNPWLVNYAYWTAYTVRPDWTMERIGQVTFAVFQPEYSVSRSNQLPASPGSVELLTAIYNDTALRGWVRQTNWGGTAASPTVPDGWEPSGYPFFTPDSSANTATTPARSSMALVKNFPGTGTIHFRTGWGEDDTSCWLRYGANFWSHPSQDAGAYACYKNGALTIHGGSYRPGSFVEHQAWYNSGTMSHNTVTVLDSGDYYSGETYTTADKDGPVVMAAPNDGGQRRVGSSYGNTHSATFGVVQGSPADLAHWMRNREYYQGGTLVAFVVKTAYTYAAVDLTAAYNNTFSHGARSGNWNIYEANSVNRSYRVQKFVRHFYFIGRGQSAYTVIYDQVISANSAFVKTNLIHTINEPTLGTYTGGKDYTVTRADNVTATSTTCGNWITMWAANLAHDGTCSYQYSGKLYGFAPDLPSATVVTQTNVGGAGHEFDIGGVNYNQCAAGQCDANLFGSNTAGFINGDPLYGSVEPGAWRIEQTPGSASTEDWFLNVQLNTDTSDTNTVSTNPTTTASGTGCIEGSNCNFVTTWKDKGDACTYTLTMPKRGVGGHVTIAGSGSNCSNTVDQDIISQQSGTTLPVNTWTVMSGTAGYYHPNGPFIPGFDFSGYAPVIDQAVLFDDWQESSGEQQRAWFGYSFTEDRLNMLDYAGLFHTAHMLVGGHPDQTSQIDPVTSVSMGYGQNTGGRTGEYMQQTYWYDFSAMSGRSKQDGLPQSTGNLSLATGAFDPLRRALVLQGSDTGAGYGEYNPATNVWSKGILCTTTSANCPATNAKMSSLTYRTVDGCMYYFGLSGFFKYCSSGAPPGSPVSTAISVSGTPDVDYPSFRQGAGWVYMPEEDKFLLIGGANYDCGSSGTNYSTTWLYDPVGNTWTNLSPTGTPPAGVTCIDIAQRVAYFPRHGVVLAWAQTDQYHQNQNSIYLYRFREGSKAGWMASPSYTNAPGKLSRVTAAAPDDAWADYPSLAVSGSTIYEAHIESGTRNVTYPSRYFYPYSQSFSGGTATQMGSAFDSMQALLNVNGTGSDGVNIAVVGGVPWACWSSITYAGDPGNSLLEVRSWNGSTWGGGGRMSSLVSPIYAQGHCKIVDIGGVPTFVFVQSYGITTTAYVYNYSSGFNAVGGALNNGGAQATSIDSVDIASDGTYPVAAWSEWTQGGSPGNIPQVYVSQWNGSAWVKPCSAAANTNSSYRGSFLSLTWLGGKPYVAFVERRDETTPAKLVVRVCSSGSWSTVGSTALNKDQYNGWAYRPRIDNDGTDLYLVWAESGNNVPWMTGASWELSFAQRPQIYSAKLTAAGTLTYLGGSINADTVNGSAQHPALTMLAGKPVTAWRETKMGSLGQVYAKRWDGTDWVALSQSGSANRGSIIGGWTVIGGRR